MPFSFDAVTRQLWQGSMPPRGGHVARTGAQVLVLAAKEYQPEARHFPGVRVIHAPLHDHHAVTDEELRTMVRVSKTMATLLRKGATVLSTCHMGWNRSGILSTLALMELGATPETAVLAVRSARGPDAMSNRTFCRIVAALHDGTLKVQ